MGKQAKIKKARQQKKRATSTIFYCEKHQNFQQNLEFIIQSGYSTFGELACHDAVKHHFLPPEQDGIGTRGVFVPQNENLCVWPYISPEAETAIAELIASPDYSLARIMYEAEVITSHPYLLRMPLARQSWDYPYKTLHWSPVEFITHNRKYKLLDCPFCQIENEQS